MVPAQSKAEPCSDFKLPLEVQQKLSTAYAGWKIVTSALLPAEDRQTWLECCARDCPGIIRGRFTDDADGYVVNLIRTTGEKRFQQIVYFRPTRDGFDIITVCPSAMRGPILVISKGPPGTYKDGYTGRTVKAQRDVIFTAQIDGRAWVDYWDGSRFRDITTSI